MDSRNPTQPQYHPITLDQPARYEIRIQGRFDPANLQDWFQGEPGCRVWLGERESAITVLTGLLPDQAALHGLLVRIRDLGLPLLYIDCLTARREAQSPTISPADYSQESSALGGSHE